MIALESLWGKEGTAHIGHTAILGTADFLVGKEGIRRLPLGNIFITSPSVASEVLQQEDGIGLSKTTAVNRAIGKAVGTGSLLSAESGRHPEQTLPVRDAMMEFFRFHGHTYIESVAEDAGVLCREITSAGGMQDAYERVHNIFMRALLRSFGHADGVDVLALQNEIVNLSGEVGIKTLFGSVAGEAVASRIWGSQDRRRQHSTRWIDELVAANKNLWAIGNEVQTREAFEANMITLLGAGTTSPAAVVCWTLYDAARNEGEKAIITHPDGKRGLTQLMARSMARHPFGFVINRYVDEDFSAAGFQFKKGETVWFLTIPGKNTELSGNIFGIGFGSGTRDCIGKHVAVGAYLSFMKVWGEHIADWTTSEPQCPLYYTTLKPKHMDILTR